jgi:hypothetical protein
MAVPSHQSDIDTESQTRDEEPFSSSDSGISIHSTRPDRSVFIEEGNADGWISTDMTVTPER